ncbi:putative nADH-quinone oxidoreductase subunit B [Mycobacteroides abscessus MAB_030201_1061]|nr:putative nADH-quinone oxidoreductase subunit B [Mycobacteroides abscessus MAB_030201_1061]
MGLEEKLPSGFLLSTVETLAGYVRKGSLWPATFGLACCAIEMMSTAGPDSISLALAWNAFRPHRARRT